MSYDGVPVSVQKGYAVLINNSKTDCTLNEYRVYSHLSRQGYRVLRHLPDLTVTSYEKQINLDQYTLDQKRSYDTEKKQTYVNVSELAVSFSETENKEDSINMSEDNMSCASRIVESNFEMLVQEDVKSMTNNMPSTSGIVSHEVVILDESTVESEIIEEPIIKATKLEEDDNDDVDLDVVEVPQQPKEIIIETIDSDTTNEDSSDDANEDSSSNSESDGDIHWKRRPLPHTSSPVREINEKYGFRSNYVTVQEFLFDRESATKKNKPVVIIDLVDDGNETTVDNELKKFYNEIELIDLASDTENETSYVGEYVKKSRKEILDGMPVMNNINGFLSVTCPDLRLIPDNIRPKKHEYTLAISQIRGDKPRQLTNYRSYRNYNQQRNYHGRGYQNSMFNRTRINPWIRHNNQGNVNPILMQQAAQIQNLAHGMMHFASTLMNQMCQPQINNNNNWNMNMSRFSNPSWQATDLFNTDAMAQRNLYNEQRSNENTNYSLLSFGQNNNAYQHEMSAQSSNNYRSQYNLTTVNDYSNSVSNENSSIYHVNANNFSPNVNSYSQNSNSSVENVFEVNNRDYSPMPTKRYNSPYKRYYRRGGGGFHRGGGGRLRHSLQIRNAAYQLNNMVIEENRHRDEVLLHSYEDPAYSREDVPLRSDGFIPLSSGSNNNQVPRSNFQNNKRRRRRNFESINVEVADDEVMEIQIPRKRLKEENNQRKRRQGKNPSRYFSVSPETKLRKQGEQNVREAEIIDIDVTPEELDVKREKDKQNNSLLDVTQSVENDVDDVKPKVSETVSEVAHHVSNVKFENTDIKTEESANINVSSNIPSAPVKSELSQEQQQDQQSSTSELVRDLKQDMSEQLDTKNDLSITQNMITEKVHESIQVKAESDTEKQSNSIKIENRTNYNDDKKTENNCISVNEMKQEPVTDEIPADRTDCSDVIQSVPSENSVINKENANITGSEKIGTEECEKPVTSWAEFKSRPVPIGTFNYEENEATEETEEEEEEDIEDDDVQPILKPEDCKNIGKIFAFCICSYKCYRYISINKITEYIIVFTHIAI